MTIEIRDFSDCTGCTACMTVCPQNAITMVPDTLGFFYPMVDASKCIDCSLCLKKCPLEQDLSLYKHNTLDQKVYGLRLKDTKELLKSQSGGAFYGFASYALNIGYIVYGVGYDDFFTPTHKRIESVKDLDELRGSKYVQSALNETYSLIRKDLEDGKFVLFSGTGCQVAGLLSILPTRLKKNLLTLDIICHGVPAPKVWTSYIKWIEKRYCDKVVNVNFRNKKYGWHSCRETFLLSTNKEIVRDSFRFFLMSESHFCTRSCCDKCRFASQDRISDLTIGDFWGWEKSHNVYNDNQGVSLCLVNTCKGQEFVSSIYNMVDILHCNVEECAQPQLLKPIFIDKAKQSSFYRDFGSKDFDYILKKYANEGLKYKIRKHISYLKNKILKWI